MTRLLLSIALLLSPMLAMAELRVVIVEGLAGEPTYSEQFDRQVAAIGRAAASVTGDEHIHILRGDDVSREAALQRIATAASGIGANDWFALFLVGHGSYNDYEYKFNIPGPDLTGEDIAAALDELPDSNQLLVNTSSASGAIAELVAADNRIVVLATRSGVERHATRFGNYFAEALSDTSADIDKNNMVSVTEAFGFAQRRVDDYFESNNQLATEHAAMSGTRGERLALARLGGARPAVVDTTLAGLLGDRDALNEEIEALRLSRDDMSATDYQSALLEKMLQLARIEDAIEARQEELDADR
ncbi:MAG: hypothetical protein P8X81_06100 [Woeseiaceae bacterium]